MKFLAIDPNHIDGPFGRPRSLAPESIALIPVYGVLTNHIVDDPWGPETTAYDDIRAALTVALDDPDVNRIILDVDSPGGKITALDPSAASTGAEVAYGVLIQDTDASAADQETVIVARDAAVAGNALIWPSAITTTEKTAAIEQLKTRGILIRKGA